MTAQIKLAWLIDDNDIDLRSYERVVLRSGLVEDVRTFFYADEALEHLKSHPELSVDLIFLDINMPGMDGFEFLDAATNTLGDSFAKVVVAMLTTSLNPADRERARQIKVVKDFINKPLTLEHVETAVKHVADMQ